MAAEFPVVFALYPHVTQLDFTGPHEYAPAPPFQSGRPELAPPSVLATAQERYARVRGDRDAAVERAAARLA
jgi:hypothetical protein